MFYLVPYPRDTHRNLTRFPFSVFHFPFQYVISSTSSIYPFNHLYKTHVSNNNVTIIKVCVQQYLRVYIWQSVYMDQCVITPSRDNSRSRISDAGEPRLKFPRWNYGHYSVKYLMLIYATVSSMSMSVWGVNFSSVFIFSSLP